MCLLWKVRIREYPYVSKLRNIIFGCRYAYVLYLILSRTSNGKSSVINAMLGSRVLPSGMGHTTNCFVQVQGTEKVEPYLLRPGSEEQEAVSSLAIAHALSDEKLHTDSLIQLYWPKDQCSLLREGVVRNHFPCYIHVLFIAL